jgi:hypothetical protein
MEMKRMIDISAIVIGLLLFLIFKNPWVLLLPGIMFLAILFKKEDKLKEPIWNLFKK